MSLYLSLSLSFFYVISYYVELITFKAYCYDLYCQELLTNICLNEKPETELFEKVWIS